MRLTAVELVRLELELRFPLLTSAGEHRHRPLSLVRIATDEGIGIGECSALEEPTYTAEYADGAEAVLRDHLIPRLLADGGPATLEAALGRLASVRGHAMAKAGLEMALLDVELKSRGQSLAAFLGVERAEGVRPQIRQNYADEGLFSVSARIRGIRGQFRIWLRRAAPGVFLLAKRLAICASG